MFNDPATTEIYTLSLHDALPISDRLASRVARAAPERLCDGDQLRQERRLGRVRFTRSEEHTSELQSLRHLVCRLLLEKKKQRDRSPSRTRRIRERRLSACLHT